MTVQNLIDSERATIATASETIAFLEALPAGLAATIACRAHGGWLLGLSKMALQDALALLPPLGLVARSQGRNFPFELTKAAKPEDVVMLPDGTPLVYPLGTHASGHWWQAEVTSKTGQVFQIRVQFTGEKITVPGYTFDGKGAFFRTRLSLVLPVTAPLEEFDKKWDQLLAQFELNALQLQKAFMVKAIFKRDGCLETELGEDARYSPIVAVLGQPTLDLLLKGAAAIAAGFADKGGVQQAEQAHVQAVLAQAVEAANVFFKDVASPCVDEVDEDVLAYFLQKKLGAGVTAHLRNARDSFNRELATLDFWLHYRKWNEGFTVSVPAAYSASGFSWKNPGFVEYAPL